MTTSARPRSERAGDLCYDDDLMNICVVGAGDVGLVTGAVFADLGNEVICVDNLSDTIAALQVGRMCFEYHSIGRPPVRRM